MKTDMHFWSYLAQFFLEWEIFQAEILEETSKHILCSVTFLSSEERLCYTQLVRKITSTLTLIS
jgi:hypothetical protein